MHSSMHLRVAMKPVVLGWSFVICLALLGTLIFPSIIVKKKNKKIETKAFKHSPEFVLKCSDSTMISVTKMFLQIMHHYMPCACISWRLLLVWIFRKRNIYMGSPLGRTRSCLLTWFLWHYVSIWFRSCLRWSNHEFVSLTFKKRELVFALPRRMSS